MHNTKTEKKKKEVLFSVGADDCKWDFYIGSGKGGQNKQKTSSAAHCVHKASGAEGRAQDSRSQLDNKRLAFKRMTETPKFKLWIKMEVGRRTIDQERERREQERIERHVENMMKPENIITQIPDGKKGWKEVDDEYFKNLNEPEEAAEIHP